MLRQRLFGIALLAVVAIAHQQAWAAELKQATLRIDGMVWPDTGPVRAKAVLEGLLGVQQAEVSRQEAQAVVHYDPRQVTIEAMIELLNDTGYRAREEAGASEACFRDTAMESEITAVEPFGGALHWSSQLLQQRLETLQARVSQGDEGAWLEYAAIAQALAPIVTGLGQMKPQQLLNYQGDGRTTPCQ